jgi:hypothetical protein
MKKNMIIGAVLFIISLTSSVAQQSASVNASVAQSFEKNFSGATQLKWTACAKSISLAQFKHSDRVCLAYFDRHGNIISSGRKVSVQELPALATEGMLASKESNEKKYGALVAGTIYEMVTDDKKEYYIPFANGKINLLIAVARDGSFEVRRKIKVATETGTPNVIARTND